jgi:hypothetical protein
VSNADSLASVPAFDSAGIDLIVHESTHDSPPIRLSEPFLELGGVRADPEEEFDSRNPFLSAVTLSSGRGIVVPDHTRLKFFSAKGELLKTVGRAGSGPGEFSQTREVCRLNGDSLLVIDYASGRVSLWDAEGHHVRTFARPGIIPMGGCYPDGTVVVQEGFTSTNSSDQNVGQYSLRRPDGSVVRKLGVFPTSTYRGRLFWEPSVIVADSGVWVADGRTYELRLYSMTSGALVRIIRVRDGTRLITEAQWTAQIDSIASRNGRRSANPAIVSRLRSLPKPDAFPAYARALRDSQGRLWIEDYENRRVWTVFTERGEVVGRLTIPWATGELAQIEEHHVVIRRHDADGMLYLSFHRTSVNRKQ